MNEYIEKARSDVAASERERTQRNTGKAFSTSGVDFTMSGKSTQGLIDYLPHGYFIAESPEVLGRYLRSLDGRVSEVRRTREALSATLDGMTGQGRIEGF